MKLNGKRIMERGKNTLAAGAGGVGSALLNGVIPSSINPKLRAGIKLLVFGALPEFAPKMKILEHVADGAAGVAGVELAHSFGMNNLSVAGIGEIGAHQIDEDYMDSPINGGDDSIQNVDDSVR
jgi:hypothetical protein